MSKTKIRIEGKLTVGVGITIEVDSDDIEGMDKQDLEDYVMDNDLIPRPASVSSLGMLGLASGTRLSWYTDACHIDDVHAEVVTNG